MVRARLAGEGASTWAWMLEEPSFGYLTPEGETKRPTVGETLREVWSCIAPSKGAASLMPMADVTFTLITWAASVAFFGFWFSVEGLLVFALGIGFVGTVTNTVWLHRYCSHRAFTFRPGFARVFCWFNGLGIAEDRYAVPHFVHHVCSDRAGDPYGPHLGRLASYFGTFLFAKRLNRAMSAEQYARVARLVAHIGFPIASYETFRRFGLLEHPLHMGVRLSFAQLFFAGLGALVAGPSGALAWLSAVAVSTLVLRDFNFSGHGGNSQRAKRHGWEFDDRTRALNQWFYGLLGAEWHNNHHLFPRSANLRLTSLQVDRAFLVIRFLRLLGVVSSYRDDMPRARERLLHRGRAPEGRSAVGTY